MPVKKNYLTRLQLADKLKNLKALILDVDGVLTDDHLYIGPDGFEIKKFYIGDGLMIVLAMRQGLEIVIMSNRYSPATTTRMNDLGVKHVIQERGDKAKIVRKYFDDNGLDIDLDETAFIGNDIMDVSLAQKVGIGIAVKNAHSDLLDTADFVTKTDGGTGAVREILELYFDAIGVKPIELFTK
ncbi:MAG: HAD hydrolase family protein [candidate division Zixibacteria bacterium]|nr:HAD hydrolase family protein [candidate division Zixibacteria bacterium]